MRITSSLLFFSATLLAFATHAESRLENISTRAQVLTGDSVMIAGFIIEGSENKTVLVRARGPSLAAFGVAGTLNDPALSLSRVTGELLESNDNWMSSARAGDIPAGLEPTDANEAAIVISLAPGAYTPIVTGADGGTGVAIVEVFELDTMARLANISTRGFVGSGDEVMIGGFIVAGDSPITVVVRGRGPSLADAGVQGVLADPVLTLTRQTGEFLDSNDNFADHAAAGNVPSELVPTNAAESALMISLDPGAYTAIVGGVGAGVGVGIVEVFEIMTEPQTPQTAQAVFTSSVASPVILSDCRTCHNPTGFASGTPLHYTDATGHETTNFETLRDYVAADISRAATILSKAEGMSHGGGPRFAVTDQEYLDLARFVELLVEEITASITAQSFFTDRVASQVITGNCQACHRVGGFAGSTPLIYTTLTGHETSNFQVLSDYVAADNDRTNTILQKALGVNHGGGPRLGANDQEYLDLAQFLSLLLGELNGS